MGKKGKRLGTTAIVALALAAGEAFATPPHVSCRLDDFGPRRFIAIGSDHETEVFPAAMKVLEDGAPDAVSIELWLSGYARFRPNDREAVQRRKNHILSGAATYTARIDGRKVTLFIGEQEVFPASETNGTPELAAGIAHAVTRGKPFYATDWSEHYPGYVFRFQDGVVTPIRVEGDAGKTTTLDILDVAGRNRYTAQALRQLYRDHPSIAHIGGKFHYEPRGGYVRPTETLQALLGLPDTTVHLLDERR